MHHLNFEITNYLQQGENNIEVVAALTILNDNIGRGKAGVKEYKNYKDQGLMSQRLVIVESKLNF